MYTYLFLLWMCLFSVAIITCSYVHLKIHAKQTQSSESNVGAMRGEGGGLCIGITMLALPSSLPQPHPHPPKKRKKEKRVVGRNVIHCEFRSISNQCTIPSREFFQRSFVNKIDSSTWRSLLAAFVLDISHPKLHGVGVANNLFFIRKIGLLLTITRIHKK